MGNYVDYAINVTSTNDITAGLRFAQEQNIRLVIKNTGHDYSGKSTGRGALGLWMHNLKSISFLSYHSANYAGPAIRMEAGVQGNDAYAEANAQGLRVVGGECPTVGLAGGYTQGGGHSAISSSYGLGADQTLQWEVVIANGTLVTASQTQNTDLYWALSGGGGGTYGVVLSLTAKAHPDGPVGGAKLSFTSNGISESTYWAAISAWHAGLPALVDSGTMTLYLVEATAFSIEALTAPNHSIASVAALLHPFTTTLASLNITYALNITSFPAYYQHFNSYFEPPPFGSWPAAMLVGGRLLPRSVVETNNDALTAAVRNITRDGMFQFSGIAVNVSHAAAGNKPGSNAVLPAWRDALISALTPGAWNFSAPLAVNHAAERILTDSIVPQLEALSPGSGCYMNEANFRQPNWQNDFYGSNYEALKAVKAKYDPEDLFYATTAVGSEAWAVDGDGRLCRV
ncbi:hypothetical protein MMC11_000305 [Xylographa trunciseda]|nr:hypothetical protein [Xylographa trunciseda]